MKFGLFMSYYKRKNSIKKFYQNEKMKLENEIFEVSYLYWIYNSKAFEICPNQHADLLRIVFTKDSLKIKRGLGLVFRPHFS